MDVESATLIRIGAWGQIASILLAVACSVLRIAPGLVTSCIGYFALTAVGIAGIRRAEGPLHFLKPFVLPGIVPGYYFVRSSRGEL